MAEGCSRPTAYRIVDRIRETLDVDKATAAAALRAETMNKTAAIQTEREEKRARKAAEKMAAERAKAEVPHGMKGEIIVPAPGEGFEAFLMPFSLDVMSRRLEKCLVLAEDLMQVASGEGGKPRNNRLAITASEHLRRTVETQSKIVTQLMDMVQAERVVREIMLILKDEAPRAAEKALLRIKALRSQ